MRDLHASNSQLQWVVDAFNLLFAGSVLAAGSLSDRFGRKGMLLAGLSVFGLASAAGGLTGRGQIPLPKAKGSDPTSGQGARRSVIRVISEGTPMRAGKPAQRPAPLPTYSVIPSTS